MSTPNRYGIPDTLIDVLKTLHLTFLFFTCLGRVQGEHKLHAEMLL